MQRWTIEGCFKCELKKKVIEMTDIKTVSKVRKANKFSQEFQLVPH